MSQPDGPDITGPLPAGVRLPAKRKMAAVRTIMALILREMSTSYGRSPGGYIWTILEPIGGLLMLSWVFSYLFRTPPLGTSFIVFYATGMLPFLAYNGISTKIASALLFSKPLLAYPSVTYTDALTARLILETMTQILVGFIIISLAIWWTGEAVSFDFAKISMAVLMTVVLGVSIGVMNCYLNSMFPVWPTLWAVLNRPLFIISGIFFLIDPLAEEYRDILLINPLAHILSMMRAGFFASYDAPYASPLYVFAFALIPGALGMLLLHRYHKDILEL